MIEFSFTGTRHGMTDAQKDSFERLVMNEVPDVLRQGCCIGADADAAIIFKRAMNGLRHYARIIGHPGRGVNGDRSCRSNDAEQCCDELLEEKSHFARNRDMVTLSHALLATPWQTREQEPPAGQGGGTWYTIQFAIKAKKPVWIIWPDGTVEQR